MKKTILVMIDPGPREIEALLTRIGCSLRPPDHELAPSGDSTAAADGTADCEWIFVTDASAETAWSLIERQHAKGARRLFHIHETASSEPLLPPAGLVDKFASIGVNILGTRGRWYSVTSYTAAAVDSSREDPCRIMHALHDGATTFAKVIEYTSLKARLEWSGIVSRSQLMPKPKDYDAVKSYEQLSEQIRYLRSREEAFFPARKIAVNPIQLYLREEEFGRATKAVQFVQNNNKRTNLARPRFDAHFAEKVIGFPGRGMIIGADGGILSGGRTAFFRSVYTPALRISRPVFWSFNILHRVYHHWLVNCLSSLAALEQMGLENELPIVMPKLSSWQKESLSAMGVSSEQIIEVGNEPILLEKVFWSDFCSANDLQWVHPAGHAFVRRRALAAVQASHGSSETGQPHEKLYISRLDTKKRWLVNERALADALEKEGYVVVVGSELSFLDQVRLCHNAKAIVALHGAGLTNGLFCRPHTKVLEIFPENFFHAGPVRACQMAGSRQGFMLGRNLRVNEKNFQDLDWEVDVAEVLKNAQHLIDTPYEQTWADPFCAR